MFWDFPNSLLVTLYEIVEVMVMNERFTAVGLPQN